MRQFQIVQTALDRLEVRLVVARDITGEEERTIGDLLLARLGHAFTLSFSYHDETPRGASGKFEDFRSEIAA